MGQVVMFTAIMQGTDIILYYYEGMSAAACYIAGMARLILRELRKISTSET